MATDVARHRRGLMVELQDEFGPVAIAIDTVLCSFAKMQNAGGAIREGFAAVAREAGMARRIDEVRAFMERAAAIGWLDDLQVDVDGRRFNVRISGWKADQERARSAWSKANQRAGHSGTDGDMSTLVPECPPTGQDRTGQEKPPVVPQGGRDETEVPWVLPAPPAGRRGRTKASWEQAARAWAERWFPDAPWEQVLWQAALQRGNPAEPNEVTPDSLRARVMETCVPPLAVVKTETEAG
jgi:hypothetical protein